MSGILQSLGAWFDDRTGWRRLVHEALYERVPGGARWRYVWGSTLVFAFVVQAITGLFLWMGYSPSAQTAWESVYYIQHEVQGGWLLRGLHHYMAQAMVVLLALHLMQVVIDGAYRAPREINFWTGLILMQIVLGLSLTGYLLPWDQKGYWATKVATSLSGIVPLVGPAVQRLVVGGTTYGHQTLTRFFAIHAGVLPALLIGFLVLHVYLFRRAGLHAKKPLQRAETTFWPDQVLKDAVACLAVLAVVLLLNCRPLFKGNHAGQDPGDYLGADLGAPADPANPYSAARPEWYFLFLFQFLKFFHGETQEIVGAIVIPGLVVFVLALMPFIGRTRVGHWFNCAFLFALLAGAATLTGLAIHEDRDKQDYLDAVADARRQAERVVVLARGPQGIPPAGAATLLRHDAKTQGPRLFGRWCASCHDHAGSPRHPKERSASDLTGFAGREWLAGLLDPHRIDSDAYFGATPHKGGEMSGFVNDTLSEATPDDINRLVIALSAEAALPVQQDLDRRDAELIEKGKKLLSGGRDCTDCHRFHGEGETTAPDLTGYGSEEWLRGMIGDPNDGRYYGAFYRDGDGNDGGRGKRMPSFAAHPDAPELNHLSPRQLGFLVDWLRGEWYEPAIPDDPNANKEHR
ncbi:MAG TPA: cytochrome b N-terminal domain-containing protein [Pirellulales bacterium]|nr:cytochrome b N-terminal domain-containing protein [Pirellulales bacterium]